MTRRSKATQQETVSVSRRLGTRSPDSLVLRVIGEASVTNVVLPAIGEIVIGRAEEADVRIDDPSISRRHVALVLGETLSVRDLGGRNGVTLRGRRLAAGEVAPLATGEIIDLGRVALAVQRGLATARPPAHSDAAARRPSSRAMRDVEGALERIAAGHINVLLLGETGVGKEVLAESIHRASGRAAKAFLRLNCGALSETLVESELFGHEKGAFTGADRVKRGLLEMAEGGTIFLDEVGELPIATQVKLLRVLEERRVLRVGSVDPRPIDVRFVAATNRDLEAEMERGRFRADLFYRLNGFAFVIPPLRERTDEIGPLAETFIDEAARRAGRERAPSLAPSTLDALLAYAWPGNIRELRNVVERAVLLADDVIGPEHLPLARMRAASPPAPRAGSTTATSASASDDALDLKRDVDALERRRILDAIERCAGNQTRAARLLNISRTTLVTRLREYGVPRPRSR